MIDVEQMDNQIRTAMRFAGRGRWHFTLETESPYGDREENFNQFPPHLRQNLMFLEGTLKKLIPNDFYYRLDFDERASELEIGYLDGWVHSPLMEIVIRTTSQLSTVEDLRLHIGDFVKGARTENVPPLPVVKNSAELFVYLATCDWEKFRNEALIASAYIQENSPTFKNAVKHNMIRSKDKVVILTNVPKELFGQ